MTGLIVWGNSREGSGRLWDVGIVVQCFKHSLMGDPSRSLIDNIIESSMHYGGPTQEGSE